MNVIASINRTLVAVMLCTLFAQSAYSQSVQLEESNNFSNLAMDLELEALERQSMQPFGKSMSELRLDIVNNRIMNLQIQIEAESRSNRLVSIDQTTKYYENLLNIRHFYCPQCTPDDPVPGPGGALKDCHLDLDTGKWICGASKSN